MSERANRIQPDAMKPHSPPIGIGGGPGRFIGPKVRPQNTYATVKRLWVYLGRQRTGLLIVFLVTMLSSIIGLVGPYLMGRAVDGYIIPKDYTGLIRICLIMLGSYLLGSIFSWVQSYVMAGVSGRMVQELRQDVFENFQQLPLPPVEEAITNITVSMVIINSKIRRNGFLIWIPLND